MCTENLCYSTENYIQLNVQRKKNNSKYTWELYITNWSYSKKLGIVFAMYQIIRLKGTSWYGPRNSQKWINISLFELVVTCIETHISVPSL